MARSCEKHEIDNDHRASGQGANGQWWLTTAKQLSVLYQWYHEDHDRRLFSRGEDQCLGIGNLSKYIVLEFCAGSSDTYCLHVGLYDVETPRLAASSSHSSIECWGFSLLQWRVLIILEKNVKIAVPFSFGAFRSTQKLAMPDIACRNMWLMVCQQQRLSKWKT